MIDAVQRSVLLEFSALLVRERCFRWLPGMLAIDEHGHEAFRVVALPGHGKQYRVADLSGSWEIGAGTFEDLAPALWDDATLGALLGLVRVVLGDDHAELGRVVFEVGQHDAPSWAVSVEDGRVIAQGDYRGKAIARALRYAYERDGSWHHAEGRANG